MRWTETIRIFSLNIQQYQALFHWSRKKKFLSVKKIIRVVDLNVIFRYRLFPAETFFHIQHQKYTFSIYVTIQWACCMQMLHSFNEIYSFQLYFFWGEKFKTRMNIYFLITSLYLNGQNKYEFVHYISIVVLCG